MKKLLVAALALAISSPAVAGWRTAAMGPATEHWTADKDDSGWYVSACTKDNHGNTVCAMANQTNVMEWNPRPEFKGKMRSKQIVRMFMLSHDYDVKSKTCKMTATNNQGTSTIKEATSEGPIVGYGMDALEAGREKTPEARAMTKLLLSMDLKITVDCPKDKVKFTVNFHTDESAAMHISEGDFVNKVMPNES